VQGGEWSATQKRKGQDVTDERVEKILSIGHEDGGLDGSMRARSQGGGERSR